MSRIATVGSAMSTLKAKLEERAETLHGRIGTVDKASEEKFALADHVLDTHEAELREMESDLRQLGNFAPLETSREPSQK